MYLPDDIYEFKRGIIKNFQEGKLTPEDKKHVFTKIELCKHGKNPWYDYSQRNNKDYDCYHIGKDYIYFSGEASTNLDRASIHLANSHKNRTIQCEVLYVKLNSPLAEAYGLNDSFYEYNRSRRYPDSIISLKFISITDPPPKDKGYRIVG